MNAEGTKFDLMDAYVSWRAVNTLATMVWQGNLPLNTVIVAEDILPGLMMMKQLTGADDLSIYNDVVNHLYNIGKIEDPQSGLEVSIEILNNFGHILYHIEPSHILDEKAHEGYVDTIEALVKFLVDQYNEQVA